MEPCRPAGGKTEDDFDLRPLIGLTLSDRMIDDEHLPWVPHPSAEGVFLKHLRLDRRSGVWANLTKVVGPGVVGRHYHVGPVFAYTLEGTWGYREHDWVAKPGSIVYEPPGDIHTLVAGDEGCVTLFVLDGGLIYVDDDDNAIGHDDVLTQMRMYEAFCREKGIEPQNLDF